MAQTANEYIQITELAKGMIQFEGDSSLPPGYYLDAQNILLTHKQPITVGGLIKLTRTPAPDGRRVLWFEPFTNPTTGSHSDVALVNTPHGDVAHGDTLHSDIAHGDSAHGDVAHSDVHSDAHADAAHGDVAHGDEAHADDPGHSDDVNKGHADSPGTHTDSHTDVAHSDDAHSDTHSDTHSDVAHTDGHSDSSHSDIAAVNIPAVNTAHGDTAHADSTENATLIVALDRGDDIDGDGSGIWEYNPNTDLWKHLWTYCFTTAAEQLRYRYSPPYFSSVPFRSRLFWSFSGTKDVLSDTPAATTQVLTDETVGVTSDNPLKYDGTYVQPIGSAGYSFDVIDSTSNRAKNQRIASFEASETWTGGLIVTDPGHRKDQLASRRLNSVGASGSESAALAADAAMYIDYVATDGGARDFLTGLLGAPNFNSDDWFIIWVRRVAGAGTIDLTFSFSDNAITKYFNGKPVSLNPTNGHWYELAIRRSVFVVGAGAPVWSDIQRFTIYCLSASQGIEFDAAYWRYNLGPTPRGAVVEMYNNQLVIADLFDAKTAAKYSLVGSPDYFDASNIARFDGGRTSLGEQDHITALWTYFDELIVGKNSSSWTFSGAGTNVSISALPLTIGIQGNRAIVETPWSLHYYYDHNVFGSRLTSRGLVSTNVTDLLQDVAHTEGHRISSIRNDPTHTIRWSFRTVS